MNFKAYHSSLPRGGVRQLADALGIAPTYLTSMAKGRRPVPARLWAAIVRESAGAVTLEELAAEAAGETTERAA